MPFSKTQICNMAILKLGGNPIASLTDGSTGAKACAAAYDMVRDRLLEDHNWWFAVVRQNLNRLEDEAESDKYSFQYTLPTDPIMLRFIDIPDYHGEDWDIEIGTGGDPVLLTNLSEVVCRYVRLITDEGEFPSSFANAFAAALAAEISVKITDSVRMRSIMQAEATAAIIEAQANGAMMAMSESRAQESHPARSTWADR